jgi:MYXO-CTERM domain-containing protein
MKISTRLGVIAIVAAADSILLASCGAPDEGGSPPTGSAEEAAVPLLSNGLLPGMFPFLGGGGKQITANPVCANPKLTYFGGPLLQTPVVVPVFWSSSVNATLQSNIGQFYADVTQSSYWTWLQEYDSVGLNPGTNQAILPGTAVAGVVIAPLKCNPGGANCALTDNDLQTELTRQIGLGTLPAPTLDCTGNVQTIYMLHFPPNIALTGPGNVHSCVNKGFCGYHFTGKYGANNTPLVYAAIMDTFTGPCGNGCGGNQNQLANATSIASHELAEATTDTDIGLDTQPGYAAPAGWGDNQNNCGEIGDICADGSPGSTIMVNGHSWVVQPLWSNKQGKCVASGPANPICSGTTVANCRKCSCGDNGKGCSGATAVCETTSTNVLFGACEACTAKSNTCTGGGTCQQSATPAQDDICVGGTCVPIKVCPAPYNCGMAPDGCNGMINCGTCTAPQTCGGGTPSNPNVCGCTPKTTCPAGFNCGTAPDGCGGMIKCGTCTAPQTCGGGTPSNPNVCGCTPLTTCPAGLNCGSASNGCGGMIQCGSCTAPQTCGGGTPSNPNVCGCTPKTTCPAGFNCGTAPDGCGGMINCGACTAPQTCGGGAPSNPNVCGCTPKTTCPAGFNCDSAPDGCGGMIQCGTCGANQLCTSNKCVTQVPDAGPDSGSGGSSVASSSSTGTGGSSAGTGGSNAGSGGTGNGGSPTPGASVSSSGGGSNPAGAGGGANTGTGAGGNHGAIGQKGGCGCEVVGDTRRSPNAPLGALAMLALAAGIGQRRRRASVASPQRTASA